MTTALNLARHDLLEPSGLTDKELHRIINSIVGYGIDYADVFFQSSYSESWVLEEGIIKGGSFDIDRGVGVRALSGEKTGFAYADDILFPALEQAAQAARSIVQHGNNKIVKAWHKVPGHQLYLPLNPINSLNENEKTALLQRVDAYARQLDPRVVQVNVSLAGEHEMILVMGSDGHMAADVRPLVRLNISVVVEEQGRREQGVAGGGGRFDYQYFMQDEVTLQYAREAVRQALVNLNAIDAPAGTMPVVLGPGWPGVLLHEAVGHGLEGDFNRKKLSAFSGKLNQQVAAKGVTVVD